MSTRAGFGFAIALAALGLMAVAACAEISGARRQRAGREERRRLETWEGEGGALPVETPAATTPAPPRAAS